MIVLVVDDDRKFAQSVVRVLQKMGHDATAAKSAENALEILFEEPVDLLVTELALRGKDGFELIEFAKHASPKTRSILMSASASAKDYKTAVAMGVVELLTKPFEGDELERAVTKSVECLRGFRGNVHGLSLPDILQTFAMSRASVTIKVGNAGVLYIDKGDLVHAVAGQAVGVPALKELLASRDGLIETAPVSGEITRTIHQRLDHLLIGLEVAIDTAAADPVRAQEIERDITARQLTEPAMGEDLPPPPARRSRWMIGGAAVALMIAAIASVVVSRAERDGPAQEEAAPVLSGTGHIEPQQEVAVEQARAQPPPEVKAAVEAAKAEPTPTIEAVAEEKAPAAVAEKLAEKEPDRRHPPLRHVARPRNNQEAQSGRTVERAEQPAAGQKKPGFDKIDDHDSSGFSVVSDEGAAAPVIGD